VDGVERRLIPIRANGAASIVHDLVAFLGVFRRSTHIVALGVSGGPWFPLFRLLCALTGRRLLVNVDGVEWQRAKFGWLRRSVLRAFNALAQWSAHRVIIDNEALRPLLVAGCARKAVCIAYPGDHVKRRPGRSPAPDTALTVCRIEPENQVEMLIEGALRSPLSRYTVVGNWDQTPTGRRLRRLHHGNPRLRLLDPVYDPERLAELREDASYYLHGHSVGGTNPSLVEMLFYDARLLCFDTPYNRRTAGEAAAYFHDVESLAGLLGGALPRASTVARDAARARYTTAGIVADYLRAMDLTP
jgi:glycosyltransferase involved in cell wall biosynthesis